MKRSISTAKAQLSRLFLAAEAAAESSRHPANQRALQFILDNHLSAVNHRLVASFPRAHSVLVYGILDKGIALREARDNVAHNSQRLDVAVALEMSAQHFFRCRSIKSGDENCIQRTVVQVCWWPVVARQGSHNGRVVRLGVGAVDTSALHRIVDGVGVRTPRGVIGRGHRAAICKS